MRCLFDSAEVKPHPAPQKYHSLMVAGLVANGIHVECLTARPITTSTHPKKLLFRHESDEENSVKYHYISLFNSPIPKLLWYKIYTFFYVLIWVMRTPKHKAVVCDVLNPHAFAALWACRLTGNKCVGIVTDIPGYMNFSSEKETILKRLWNKWQLWNIRRMTHFIVLTKFMNDIINPQLKKPYTVIEGIADTNMANMIPAPCNDGLRHITYTGTLNEAFGVRLLLEAFMNLPQKDVTLEIYGRGPMQQEMHNYEKNDPRIHYHGVVPINEAILAQCSSYLLVNPRTSGGDFTRYSFPSKNMEYMATGVPLIACRLPGIPEDYYEHLFLFEDETTEGMSHMIDVILNMPEEQVRGKGIQGKRFVMEYKNNIKQAGRVLEMLYKAI